MSEEFTLEALEEAIRSFQAKIDTSKLPRVIHILGGDAYYYRVLNFLRKEVAITLRPDPKGARLFPDSWYGIKIKRHEDHGETDSVFVELASGDLVLLDPRGGKDDN